MKDRAKWIRGQEAKQMQSVSVLRKRNMNESSVDQSFFGSD
jgi:hypothetical protein